MIEDEEDAFLVDTNVLVYAYDTSDKKKHKIALELLDKCWQKSVKYAISVQSLSELFVIITQKIQNKISVEQAEQIVSDIGDFSNFIKLNFDSRTVLSAIKIHKESKCHYFDSLIAATMIENKIFDIYTENVKDFSKIEGIKVVNPFV